MNNATVLYMFAIMPPEELSSNIHLKRTEFFEKYHFRKALKPPVHITLYNPFHIDGTSLSLFEHFVVQLQNWADQQSSFQIDLRNYNFFENPGQPVVFIDVVKNRKLQELHSRFIKKLKKHMPINNEPVSYKPHITIGYKDVTPEVFPQIKTYYSKQTFSGSFPCNSFYLWKHNGKNWEIDTTFHLNGKVEQLKLF